MSGNPIWLHSFAMSFYENALLDAVNWPVAYLVVAKINVFGVGQVEERHANELAQRIVG